jgi:lipoprotein-anchoring transpeptidase ErfK/SrfK
VIFPELPKWFRSGGLHQLETFNRNPYNLYIAKIRRYFRVILVYFRPIIHGVKGSVARTLLYSNMTPNNSVSTKGALARTLNNWRRMLVKNRKSGISGWLLLYHILFLFATTALTVDCSAAYGAEPDTAASSGGYYIEISISRTTLTLYKKTGEGGLVPLREYPVGSAVRGLDVYPTGLGLVTAIYFDPWWYPTPYSRQVFRERGIELPRALPPGHPLNYMGKFKITLSHRTSKGAIYRIHGTNNPNRVGRRVTGGCFAMHNDQGLELARTISVGTEVNILP